MTEETFTVTQTDNLLAVVRAIHSHSQSVAEEVMLLRYLANALAQPHYAHASLASVCDAEGLDGSLSRLLWSSAGCSEAEIEEALDEWEI